MPSRQLHPEAGQAWPAFIRHRTTARRHYRDPGDAVAMPMASRTLLLHSRIPSSSVAGPRPKSAGATHRGAVTRARRCSMPSTSLSTASPSGIGRVINGGNADRRTAAAGCAKARNRDTRRYRWATVHSRRSTDDSRAITPGPGTSGTGTPAARHPARRRRSMSSASRCG